MKWIVGTTGLGNYWKRGNTAEGIIWKDGDKESGICKIAIMEEGLQLL